MPSMSAAEQWFCRSAPWQAVAGRLILPWALQGERPEGALLEIGAGVGTMAASTARRFPRLQVTATDIDPAMVGAARHRLGDLSNVAVQQADVTSLPFEDQSYDVVASYLMLHHVIEWRDAVAEVARVLRPGGTLVGYDLTATRLAEATHWADRSPHRLIGLEELAPALRRAGFDIVEVRPRFAGHVVQFVAHHGR